MPFTDEERRQWHEEKRQREYREPVHWSPEPAEALTSCVYCLRPFGLGEGIITEDVSLCYSCADR